MNWLKKFFLIFILVVVLILLSWNLQLWQQPILGSLLLAVYLLVLAYLWQGILIARYYLFDSCLLAWGLGLVLSLLLISFFLGLIIIFYTVTTFIIWLVLVIVSIISLFFYYQSQSKSQPALILPLTESGLTLGHWRWLLLVGFSLVWLMGWWWLIISPSQAVLVSPWQALSVKFGLIFFVLMVLLQLLIFSKIKINLAIILIIAGSVLVHSYVAFSHILPAGGDVWRHLKYRKYHHPGHKPR